MEGMVWSYGEDLFERMVSAPRDQGRTRREDVRPCPMQILGAQLK